MPRMSRLALPLIALLAAPAFADTAPLDLRLPARQAGATQWRAPADVDAAPATRVGTDYDGLTRAPREPARVGRACPPAADGSESAVTGAVTTGIGHASRGGSSNWQAVDLNLCREYATNDGGARTVNLGLRAARYEGPGWHGRHHHGIGGFGPHAFDDPWLDPPVRPYSVTGERRPWR
ncbi:hypothetical protein [Coralloluteibacterium thermophilus]|uniref:Secreted protein n=1 Tax=Coralloluteibacterium thermophilum TaxID=2707049 RepID=A0ABV9NGI3_9GAMM